MVQWAVPPPGDLASVVVWAVLVVSVAVTSFLSIVLTPPSIIITTVLHYTELTSLY